MFRIRDGILFIPRNKKLGGEEASAHAGFLNSDLIGKRVHELYIPLPADVTMLGGMQADDLTREQTTALKNKLRPMLAYLGKLKRRMVQRGFLNEDPLLTAVADAENAVHALHVQVHYLGCGECCGAGAQKESRPS